MYTEMKPADLYAHYSGTELNGQSLIPVGNSFFGETTFKDWLNYRFSKNSSEPHWEKFTEIKNPHSSDGDEFLDDAIRFKI
jgi:hypothetical protein